MPSYAALRAELDKTAYAGLSDQEAADLLNAPGAAVQGTVTPHQLLKWGAKTSVRAAVQAGATSNVVVAGVSVAGICLTVQDMLTTGLIGFDTADPDNVAMLAVLVAAQVMTPAQRDNLLALGASPGPSAAQTVFGAAVSANDVAHARSLS